ncbi:MAG: hypothetical protein GDA55_00140 [Cellvibrionales bacterium]|nr:hypothetical protein [Cellvibrionales bacterium]
MTARSTLFTALAGLLVAAVLTVANLPLQWLAGERLSSLTYTDIDGATLLGGSLWLTTEGPGLLQVDYHWCPRLALLSWCVRAAQDRTAIAGRVELHGSRLRLHRAEITQLDLRSLGLGAGVVDARFDGRIDQLEIALGDCPLQNITRLRGTLSTADIRIFGHSSGPHQVDLTHPEPGQLRATLQGDAFSGQIQIEMQNAAARYTASGELQATGELAEFATLASTIMRPLGENRFAWNAAGELPCQV